MRPSFYPRLVNGPFDDPGLFIPFLFEKRAILFDLGDIYTLSARDVLKISHVFISHTHMDHFSGFERLLRICLGREKRLCFYGPEGFLRNLEGKLAGYSWNLVDNFTHQFIIQATEVRSDCLLMAEYPLHRRFLKPQPSLKKPFGNVLVREPALSATTVLLDHGIPCLGFSIRERFHVNIRKDSLRELGLETGSWLKDFKQALFHGQPLDSDFVVGPGKKGGSKTRLTLGNLVEQIAIITPGQHIAYVTDVVYDDANAAKITQLAQGADHLFIEAAFLEKDRDIAKEKCHLTAWQAGTIAGRAGVKQFTLFHFSPRYTGMGHLFEKEAQAAYEEGYDRA